MRITTLWRLWALLFACCLAACNEDEIYFTQDELIGDILTGKQVRLEDNTLVLYTSMSDRVNVHGTKGTYTVKSADKEIATVIEYNETGCSELQVQGCKEGNTTITVTDSRGNTAGFFVTVRNVEELWNSVFICERNEEFYHIECLVTGISSADSVAVVEDAYAHNTDYRFVIKSTFMPPSNVYRMLVYDAEGKVLIDGPLRLYIPTEGKLPSFRWEVYSMKEEILLASYAYRENGGAWVVKDLTEEYRAKYPSVNKVELWFPVRIIKE